MHPCVTLAIRPSTARRAGSTAAALLAFAFPVIAQSPARAPDNLVSWWKAEGNVLDSFGANNGTFAGLPAFTAGKVNQAFVFDSNDDRASIPHQAGLNPGASGFTVEFWIKSSPSQSGEYAPIDKSHGFVDNTGWAIQGAGGGLGCSINVNGGWVGVGTASPFMLDFNWHHIACVIDTPNGRMRMYIDAALLPGQTVANASISNNTRPLLFGYASGGGTPTRFFRGSLDEVTIYDRALCTDEVRSIYLASAAGKVIAPPPPPPPPTQLAPGATSWWKGESNAFDTLGTNHGALTGTPGFASAYVNQGFVFDSNDDRVSIPHAANLNPGANGFSVEFWVKGSPIQPGGIYTVIDKSHGFVDSTGWTLQGLDGSLQFIIGAPGAPNADPSGFVGSGSGANRFLLDYCWHHMVGTYDPADRKVRQYVDCVLEPYQPSIAPATIANNTRLLLFGYASGGGSPTRFFRGSLDEVTIYDRPLTLAEVEALCHAGRAGKVQIPNTVPIVVITSPADGAVVGSPSVGVTGTISDVNATTVTSIPSGVSASLPGGGGNVSGTVTLVGADGLHSIALSATNLANNTAGTSISVILDTTPPGVIITAPLEGAILGDPSLTVNVSVADLTATSLDIGGSAAALPAGGGGSSAMLTLVEGANTIAVQVIDAAGNTTTVERHVTLDLSAPIVSIDSPADGACFGPGGATVPVTATVDDLTATSVTSVPTGVATALPAGGGIASGVVSLAEGNNTITVSATDATARTGSNSITVVLDTTAPSVSLVAPANGAIVRGTIDLQAAANDALPGSGVASLVFAVDGNPFGSPTPAPYEAMLDTTTLSDGSHIVTATATDGKDNTNVAIAMIHVDNTAPTVAFVVPANNALVAGTFVLQANVADNGTGVSSVVMLAGGVAPTIDGSTTYAVPVASDTRAASENSTRWLDGPLALEVRVVDAAGNEASSMITVNIDNTAPDKSLISPVDQSVVSGVITIHAAAQDPNLAEIRILVDNQLVATSATSPLITTFDTATDLDGVMEITVVVVDSLNNQSTCTAHVFRSNLTFDFKPESLNLRARGQGVVTAHVESHSLAQMLPLVAHVVTLRVPGGNPVLAIGGGAIGDGDRDGIPDTTIRFDRTALLAAINAGIAANLIPAAGPIPIRLFVDGNEVGADTARPAGN